MRRFSALGATTALTVGLVVAPPASATTDDTDPFFGYDRPATYHVVRTDVRVPVRDGNRISCQLYRPGSDPTTPAPGRFPGIVYEYTAYANYANHFGQKAGYFVERGYHALVCQARGSGSSPGWLDPFGPLEQRDNHDVIEWLAARPWSTGRIGQMGVSYGGHSSLLVAVNQPPHLEAIIPVNGIHDWYENTIYRGGIYSARIRGWQEAVAPDTLRTYPRHPYYDRFWEQRSVMSRWDRLTVPTLEINGWYDRYRDGMVKNQQARPDNVWLVSGPWEHGSPEGQYAAIDNGAYLAWWDHWLRRDADAPLPREKITSYETPGPGAGTGWQQFDQWPPRAARTLTLAMTADGELARGAGRPGSHDFTVNTRPGPSTPDERLTFTTGPLARDLVLAGGLSASVRAEFTATDGNLAVIVYDVAPDGTETRVTEGWRKASHRASHRYPLPVVPGVRYDVTVPVWPTHYRLAAGHRLKITVSSDDYPEIDADAPGGRVSVAVGARGSALELSVLR